MKNVYPFITSNNDLEETTLLLGTVVTPTCSKTLVCVGNFVSTLDHLKGYCRAVWQLYKKLEGVFASIEFQN